MESTLGDSELYGALILKFAEDIAGFQVFVKHEAALFHFQLHFIQLTDDGVDKGRIEGCALVLVVADDGL